MRVCIYMFVYACLYIHVCICVFVYTCLYMRVWNQFMFPFVYIFQICDGILAFLWGIFSPNPRTIMSDKVLLSPEVPQSSTTKMSKILLQRAEEIFPALKASTVSVVCMKWFYELVLWLFDTGRWLIGIPLVYAIRKVHNELLDIWTELLTRQSSCVCCWWWCIGLKQLWWILKEVDLQVGANRIMFVVMTSQQFV